MRSVRAGLTLGVLLASALSAVADTQVSGNISSSTTWTLSGSPYIVTGDVTVQGALAPVLTIEPGVTVKFNSARVLQVGNGSPGGLQAVGTAENPITFTSSAASPTRGAWRSVFFGNATLGTSRLAYATVAWGGSIDAAGIFVDRASPTFEHVTVTQSSTAGMKVTGVANPTITSSTITANAGAGLYLQSGATVSATDLTLTDNGGFAISQEPGITLAAAAGFVATGNGTDAIELRDGTITAAATWKKTELPYVLTGNVTVQGASTPVLTIEPGVTVKLSSARVLVIGNGSPGGLQAVGTAENPITFTSSAASPTRGAWRSVYFGNAALATSRLAYATVAWGGSADGAGIFVDRASPTFEHVTVTQSSTAGMKVTGVANPTVSSSTITANTGAGLYLLSGATVSATDLTLTDNGGFAISQDPGITLAAATGLVATGNGTNAIELRDGTITAAATWRKTELPYVVTGNVTVQGALAPVLTIEPGVTVKFNSARVLQVGSGSPGGLLAVGTAENPITFTSSTASPARGAWRGIFFWNATLATSRLAYATVAWGGSDAAGVFVDRASPTIEHVTVTQSSTHGMKVTGVANPTVSSSTITANTGAGLYLLSGATVSATDLTLTDNGGFAISQEPGITLAAATGLVATGNGTNAIELRGGTITAAATWKKTELPYVSTGDVAVQGASGPVLTIEPGVTVKFSSGRVLQVGNGSPGGLQAVGTAENPITFTSSAASPTRGAWRCVSFGNAALATSHLAYATVVWGGSAEGAGIFVDRASPTIEHVTVTQSSTAGIKVTGVANPTITSSTMTANAGAGLYLQSGATVSAADVTLTDNGGFAISQDPGITLAAATGFVATGNGTNAIELREGTITAAATWKKTGLPYVSTADVTVQGVSAPVLTIEPGVTVKFNSARLLQVGNGSPGGLQAVGTAENPITFTSSAVSPTRGAWRCIRFGNAALATSRLAYATVAWGGSGEGAGIYIDRASPTIDHVTVLDSSGKGVYVTGAAAAPQISTLIATANATTGVWIDNGSPLLMNSVVSAGTGPGIVVVSGQPIIETTTIGPVPPGGSSGNGIELRGGRASISLSTISGYTGAGVYVSGGNGHIVRNCVFSGNGSGLTNAVPSTRIYAYLNYWSDPSGPSGSGFGSGQSVSTGVAFDPWLTTVPNVGVYVSSFGFSGSRFNPNDGPTRWELSSNVPGAWTLSIRDEAQNVVRTINGTATPVTLSWDGKDSQGVLLPDAPYTYLLENVSAQGGATAPAKGRLRVDTSLHVQIVAPGETETLSNVYADGRTAFPIQGSAAFSGMTSWLLEYGAGVEPVSWTTLASNSSSVVDGTFVTWETIDVPSDVYTVRLQAFDSDGGVSTDSVTPLVTHFKAASNKWEFDPHASQTITYSSVVPFPLTERLYVKNEAGSVVRTLTNTLRAAGTYLDTWDGRDDAGALVPDGFYSFFADLTDAPHFCTYDISSSTVVLGGAGGVDNLSIPAFDPFAGRPMTFSYDSYHPGRVTIMFSPRPRSQGEVVGSCDSPPEFCALDHEYRSSQPQTFSWAGVDPTGRYRGDVRQVALFIEPDKFPKNGVVVYGSPTAISNLTLSPTLVRPGIDSLQIGFDLALATGDSAIASISFLNQDSLSTLRTISLPDLASGHHTASWDGLADNGARVAEGNYLVTVTATDGSGNKRTAQLMTVLQY